MTTQDEIFLKEIELERWKLRLEEAKEKYDTAGSGNCVSRAIEWANIRDIYLYLEKKLEAMRGTV
jgi:hypothetical protein